MPHVLVRFMAIESEARIPRARRIAVAWTGISLVGALADGMTGIAFFRDAAQAELVRVGRIGVVAIAAIAAVLALDRDNKVMGLVSYAWAGFGAAFGPAMLMSLYWKKMSRAGALASGRCGGTRGGPGRGYAPNASQAGKVPAATSASPPSSSISRSTRAPSLAG